MSDLAKDRVVKGTVASSLMWLYLYAGMGANMLPSANPDGPLLRIFVSFGLIAFYASALAMPCILGKKGVRVPSAIAIAAVLAANVVFEIAQPHAFSSAPISYLSYFLQGLSLGFAYAQMGVFLILLSGRTAAVSLTAAMAAAAVGNLLLDFCAPLLVDCALKAAIIIALVLFLQIPFDSDERIKPRKMFAEYPDTRPLFSELFFISILYGFMVMFASIAVTEGAESAVILGAAYLASTLALLFLATVFDKRIGFLSIRWVVVPVITIVIVPLTIVPLGEGALFLAGVLGLFQILEASSSLSLAESAREHDLPLVSAFVLLRLLGTIGLLIGRVVCMAAVTLSPFDFRLSFKVVIAALIIILVAWRAVISYRTPNGVSDHLIGPDGQLRHAGFGGEGTWQSERDSQLRSVAAAHGLSEREMEVFLLLAKGRNAEYIGRSLYISENTVRSHIQRIYRKLDTHSQQELLDLIDKTAQ